MQTHDEATVYVKELDLFVTVKFIEDTLAVLSRGKFFDDHGYSYEWTCGQILYFIKDGRKIQCHTVNYVLLVLQGLSTGSSSSATPTSPTSSSQNYVNSTMRQATKRSEHVSERAQGDLSPEPPKKDKKQIMVTAS